MALMTCPDCNRQISSSAPACPNCGRPMKSAPLTPEVHGTGEGCFLKTMNIGCAITFAFIALIVVLILLATHGHS